MKQCKKCNQLKPESDFYIKKNKNGKSYIRGACKKCHIKETAISYRNSTRDKTYNRFRNARYKYGISKEEYVAILEKQNYSCAICNRRFDSLCVDHNHETNKIRGLLCHNCNRAIGLISDNPEIAVKMAEYLHNAM